MSPILEWRFGSSPLARGTFVSLHRVQNNPRLIPARAGNISPRSSPARPMPAHPRSRGEHLPTVFSSSSHAGSSPLARGTFCRPQAQRRRMRLIPARAGNICSVQKIERSLAAHPRSRGEHFSANLSRRSWSGSSPLARGTYRINLTCNTCPRLIPARAGNMRARC